MTATRLLFADQLGPHFDDGGPVILVESAAAWAKKPMHRAKAHLILSAMRHRAAELGERARYIVAPTFRRAIADTAFTGTDLEVVNPTSWGARTLVRDLGARVLPSRGFVTDEADFAEWAAGRPASRLVLEQFYRHVRASTGVLMEGAEPVGGRFNFDHDNRQPPPRGAVTLGLPEPWWPTEDAIDAEVRVELDRWEAEGRIRFLGVDGPRRFAATREEALAVLADFVECRLNDFGPFEDAALTGDWTMSHSMLSVPLNLGLLHPREVIDAVVAEHAAGRAPLASVEAVVRQIAGWRDWVWHLYWHLGEDYVERSNALDAHEPLPAAFTNLDGSGVKAACLSHVLDTVGRTGWTHHIERLMILGNWGLQRGYDPAVLNEWFTSAFVDGTPWVMPANVVGMSQHADGGIVATKPYAAGGAYISKMTDYCSSCPFNPKKRLGDDACPFTAGYWAFLDRVEPRIRSNHRMAQPLAGLRRLVDREAVVAQEAHRTEW